MASGPSHRSYNDLLWENAFFRKRLSEAKGSYRQLAIKSRVNRLWKGDKEFERAWVAYGMPFLEEERFPREATCNMCTCSGNGTQQRAVQNLLCLVI